MGIRFRKSIKVGGMRVNLSKSGVGYSVGGKGFRVTKKAGGGTRTTASIPGTGISHVSETSKKSTHTQKNAIQFTPAVTPKKNSTSKTSATTCAILGTIFLVCGILFMQSLPLLSLVAYVLGIVFLVKWIKRARKAAPAVDESETVPGIEDHLSDNQ